MSYSGHNFWRAKTSGLLSFISTIQSYRIRTDYTINVLVDEELYTECVRVRTGDLFKYIQHIFRNKEGDKEREVSVVVYKDGEATPLEELTYHLR